MLELRGFELSLTELTNVIASLDRAPLRAVHELQAPPATIARLDLEDGSSLLLQWSSVGRIGPDHPFNAEPRIWTDGDQTLLEYPTQFRSLSKATNAEDFARFGEALGTFHLENKGVQPPGYELHDAAWFSRSAPFVLAEVASMAERGEYDLTLPELGQLEEAGIMLAELSEPLTGLRSSFVHGFCTFQNAGFVGDRACMRDWRYATTGFPWLDVACLSREVEDVGRDALVALVASYADAADYPVGVLADLLPFVRALHDVYVLDRWNHELTGSTRASGSLKLDGERRVRRLLELVQT